MSIYKKTSTMYFQKMGANPMGNAKGPQVA